MQYKQGLPVYIQIKDDLIKKIQEGKWQENQKIPSEQQLITEYNVGRGTVREALKMVIDEGYLFIKKGIGTFVSQKDVGLTIEPFVSLTYFIKMRGLKLVTSVLEERRLEIDEALEKKTGLALHSKCLYVKRVRILEDSPIAIEEFYFSEKVYSYLENYDFTQGISHYLFEDKKIEVGKMSMDFEVVSQTEEVKNILDLDPQSKMIKSNRIVRMNPDNELLYYLEFYCGENLSRIGLNGFV